MRAPRNDKNDVIASRRQSVGVAIPWRTASAALWMPAFAGMTMLCATESAIGATTQWKPDHAVELVIGTAPGSGPDRSARLMQKIFQDGKYFAVPVVVVNKPGA